MDRSHKDINERAAVSTVIGSKGGGFERGFARRLSMVGDAMDMVLIILFVLKFLVKESDSASQNFLGSQNIGELVGSSDMARMLFSYLFVLA